MINHTPTPLIDLYDGADKPVSAEFMIARLVSGLGISVQKAAYIVRAVNCHEELIRQLKGATDLIEENLKVGAYVKAFRNTIAKAEEK